MEENNRKSSPEQLLLQLNRRGYRELRRRMRHGLGLRLLQLPPVGQHLRVELDAGRLQLDRRRRGRNRLGVVESGNSLKSKRKVLRRLTS